MGESLLTGKNIMLMRLLTEMELVLDTLGAPHVTRVGRCLLLLGTFDFSTVPMSVIRLILFMASACEVALEERGGFMVIPAPLCRGIINCGRGDFPLFSARHLLLGQRRHPSSPLPVSENREGWGRLQYRFQHN